MKRSNRVTPAVGSTTESPSRGVRAAQHSDPIADLIRVGPSGKRKPTVITLSPDLIDEVRYGREVATIRKGHRKYVIGPAIFDAERTKIPITITALHYRMFQDLTDEDARVNGNVSRERLKASLKTYYPKIKNTDELTIIHFQVLGPSGRKFISSNKSRRPFR